jgi:hypothetical protein
MPTVGRSDLVLGEVWSGVGTRGERSGISRGDRNARDTMTQYSNSALQDLDSVAVRLGPGTHSDDIGRPRAWSPGPADD